MKREFLSPSEGYEKGGINKYQTCRRRRRRKRRQIQRHGTWFIIQVSTMAVVYMLLGSITTERAESGDQSEQVFCIACISREKEIKEKERRTKVEEKQGLEMGVDTDG